VKVKMIVLLFSLNSLFKPASFWLIIANNLRSYP
jgi:hypothetical protein